MLTQGVFFNNTLYFSLYYTYLWKNICLFLAPEQEYIPKNSFSYKGPYDFSGTLKKKSLLSR